MDQELSVLDFILSKTSKLEHAELELRLPPGFLEFLRTTMHISVIQHMHNTEQVGSLPTTLSNWQKCLAESRRIYNSSSRPVKRKLEMLARQTRRDLRYATDEGMTIGVKREMFALDDDDDLCEPSTSTITIPRCELPIQDKRGEELEKRLDNLLEYRLSCPCPVGSCCSKDEMQSFKDIMVHFDSFHEVCSIFVCSYCVLGFHTYQELQKHTCEGNNTKDMSFCRSMLACTGCGQQFTVHVSNKNDDDWKHFCHFMINHNSSNMQFVRVYSSAQFGVCATIRLQFLPSFARHLKHHCDQCDVPIRNFADLRNHSHSEGKNCCNEQFSTDMDYLKHIRQKHLDKKAKLAEYLLEAESRTFYGNSTATIEPPRSSMNPAAPIEESSLKKLFLALRGPSQNKMKKVNVYSLIDQSNYLKGGLKLRRMSPELPENELGDDVYAIFCDEAHIVMEPLKEYQRQIDCFKRITMCQECCLITDQMNSHQPYCQSAHSSGTLENDKNMVKILLPENSLPNTDIACPVEYCEERCCSLHGLQSHLAMQHSIQSTLRIGQELGAEYPVTDTVFTKQINVACFLTEDGEITEEKMLGTMNENKLRHRHDPVLPAVDLTEVITLDDDENEPLSPKQQNSEDYNISNENKENESVALEFPLVFPQPVAQSDILGSLSVLDRTCPYCGLLFLDEEHLGKHILSHSDFSTGCKTCRCVFATFMDLYEHQNTKHSILPVIETGKVDEFVQCAFCFGSLTRSTMFSHQLYECSNAINCGICGVALPSLRESSERRIFHMIDNHGNEYARFGCVCQRSFSHFSLFMEHICQNPSPQLRTIKITDMMEHLDYERLRCPTLQALIHILSKNTPISNSNVETPLRIRPTPPRIRKITLSANPTCSPVISPLSDTRSEPAHDLAVENERESTGVPDDAPCLLEESGVVTIKGSPDENEPAPVLDRVDSIDQVPEEDLRMPPEIVQVLDAPASCGSGKCPIPSRASSGPPEWTHADDSDEIMVFSEVVQEERPFHCIYCSRKFHKEKQLKRHVTDDHRNDCKDVLCEKDYGLPKEGNFYICHRENAAFESQSRFKAHYETHKDEIHACPHCTIIAMNASTLKKHLDEKSNTNFLCLRCKPILMFKEEWHLYEHLRSEHRADLVYYCKGCNMATCNPDDPQLFFHIKFNWCGKLQMAEKLSSLTMGICPASELVYQPDNIEEYEEQVRQNPENFIATTACAHRSFARHSVHYTTCPEIHYPGSEKCFGLVPFLRYVNILQSIVHGNEISQDEVFRRTITPHNPPCPYKRIEDVMRSKPANSASGSTLGGADTSRQKDVAKTPSFASSILQPGRIFTEEERLVVRKVLQEQQSRPGGPTMTPLQISQLKSIVAQQPGAPNQPITPHTSKTNRAQLNSPVAATLGRITTPVMVRGAAGSVENTAVAQNRSMQPPVARPGQPPIGATVNRQSLPTATRKRPRQNTPQSMGQPIVNPRTLAEALNGTVVPPQPAAVVCGPGQTVTPRGQVPQQPICQQYPPGTRIPQNPQHIFAQRLQEAQHQQIQYQRMEVPGQLYQIHSHGNSGQQFNMNMNYNQQPFPQNSSTGIQPWPHRYQCSVCGGNTRFGTENEVLHHMIQMHGLDTRLNVTFKLECPLVEHCNNRTVFDDVQKFRKHINTAHADKFAYHSSDCGSRFHTQDKAQLHELQHSEEAFSCCYICGKNGGWKNYAEKMRHYCMHCVTSTAMFGCTICKRIFNSEANFFKHFDALHRDLPIAILNARESYKFSYVFAPQSFEVELTSMFLYYLGL